MARKKKKNEDVKETTVAFRSSYREKDFVDAVATSYGISTSQFVRRATSAYIDGLKTKKFQFGEVVELLK